MSVVRAILPVLCTAALAMAGCGGGDDDDPPKRSLYTATQVIDHFKRETGDVLVRGPLVTPGLEVLHAPRGATAMDEKYGVFSIYVVSKDPKANIDRFLTPADKSETVDGPDANGIYWKRTCPPKLVRIPCFFTANRKLGHNLLLAWIAGDKRETNARFARVSRVLADLP